MVLGSILSWDAAAWAQAPTLGCAAELRAMERTGGLPTGLALSVASVESGRLDPVSGRVEPWPWAINVAGTGYFFATKAEAIAAVEAHRAQGVQSIDVGCMQISLLYHPAAFATLEDAFDPATNVAYGVRFLRTLYAQTGAWPAAVAAYHSRTPEIGGPYADRVLARWTGVPAALLRPGPGPAAPAADPNHTPEFARLLREAADDHRRLLASVGREPGPILPRAAARTGPARFAALP